MPYVLPPFVSSVVCDVILARLHQARLTGSTMHISVPLPVLEEAIFRKTIELGRKFDARMLHLDKLLHMEGWTCSRNMPEFIFTSTIAPQNRAAPSLPSPPPHSSRHTPRRTARCVGFEPDISLFD